MTDHLGLAISMIALMTLLLGVAYPFGMTGLAQALSRRRRTAR